MMYHATIPNGNYVEQITVEAKSVTSANTKATNYIHQAFGPNEAPALVKKWIELMQSVDSGIVHFAENADEG